MAHHNPIFQKIAFSYFDKHGEFHELAKLVGTDRFFITGATGVFGQWFLEFFNWMHTRRLGEPMATVLSRRPHTYHFQFVNTVIGDIGDFVVTESSFEYLLHLAAPSARDTFQGMSDIAKLEQLYRGTKRVLEVSEALVTKRSLIASSGAIYGGFPEHHTAPISEENRTSPLSSEFGIGLALGKRISEFLCQDAVRTTNCDLSIARLFSFVGPGLPVDIHYAIGNFVEKAVQGEDIIIIGDGKPSRSYMFLGDMVYWLLMILIKGINGSDYNVGSTTEITMSELATKIKNLVNSDIKISVLGQSNKTPGNPVNYFYIPDTNKAKSTLGLKELTSIDDALKIYAGYLQQKHSLA